MSDQDENAWSTVSVRVPSQIRKILQDRAKANVRSVNGEIIVALQRHLGLVPDQGRRHDSGPEMAA